MPVMAMAGVSSNSNSNRNRFGGSLLGCSLQLWMYGVHDRRDTVYAVPYRHLNNSWYVSVCVCVCVRVVLLLQTWRFCLYG